MDEVKKPVETLRDGNVKAAIWENDSEKGAFHSVSFARSYRDKEGNYADANRFSGADLLKLSRLAEQSYDAVQKRRASPQREPETQTYAETQREKAGKNPRDPEQGMER